MKNKSTLFLVAALLFGLVMGCANPFVRSASLYKCKSEVIASPKSAEDFVKIANDHGGKFEMDCALGACAEAVRLDPKSARAYSCRGAYTGEQADALKDFDYATKLDPNFYSPYYYRSAIYDEQGETDRALEEINAALKLCPQSADCHDVNTAFMFGRRAGFYLKKNDLERAVADYSEALRVIPTYAKFYSERAEVYRKMGRTELADADEAKAAELERDKSTTDAPKQNSNSNDTSASAILLGNLNGRATSLPQPPYPALARAAHASGKVVVMVVVSESGEVVDVSVRSGHPLLHAAAVAAARQARFKPLVKNGKAIRFSGDLHYNFVAQN